jgi:cytochrome c oxidase accessory protein FixG
VTPPVSPERVLSTLNRDGTRHVLHPKLAKGRFLRGRRIAGFALIALFVLLPRIRIGGRPALLIDLSQREVAAFGTLFRPTDGFLLALLGITVVSVVFLVTALYGRVWCGWGCPQSVYLEHVFRPIERWLEGSRGQRVTWWRRGLKLGIFAGLAFALANVFLAYFVGTDRLEHWVFESPREHLGGFSVVMGVSALMFFDFAYFREQTCIVACPYGRLQSVLLDRQSLIVGYDARRGEPRAKVKKQQPSTGAGDCIDCGACVTVCPTGIDIRGGLQMECIGCAQCIDVCDSVMEKVGRRRGLIRYTSQDELAGKRRRILRTRTVVYPVLLVTAASAFLWKVSHRSGTEVTVQRLSGPSFTELPGGRIAAQVDVKIENTTDDSSTYTFTVVDPTVGQLRSAIPSWQVPPHESRVVPLFVDVPRSAFVRGQVKAILKVRSTHGFEHTIHATLFGPERRIHD